MPVHERFGFQKCLIISDSLPTVKIFQQIYGYALLINVWHKHFLKLIVMIEILCFTQRKETQTIKGNLLSNHFFSWKIYFCIVC